MAIEYTFGSKNDYTDTTLSLSRSSLTSASASFPGSYTLKTFGSEITIKDHTTITGSDGWRGVIWWDKKTIEVGTGKENTIYEVEKIAKPEKTEGYTYSWRWTLGRTQWITLYDPHIKTKTWKVLQVSSPALSSSVTLVDNVTHPLSSSSLDSPFLQFHKSHPATVVLEEHECISQDDYMTALMIVLYLDGAYFDANRMAPEGLMGKTVGAFGPFGQASG